MKKLALFVCFVVVVGLAAVEAQRNSFSFTGSEIQAFKYRASASSDLVNMKSKVDTVYMFLNPPEMGIEIEFRDGTPSLTFMCHHIETTQMNGYPVGIYTAWQIDPKTNQATENFRLMLFQYGNRYVYLYP